MLKNPDFTKSDVNDFRKKYPKLRFNHFEIDFIKKYANLTSREEQLLELKNAKDPPSIEECAEIMQMSVSTVSRTTTDLIYKILRLFEEQV